MEKFLSKLVAAAQSVSEYWTTSVSGRPTGDVRSAILREVGLARDTDHAPVITDSLNRLLDQTISTVWA